MITRRQDTLDIYFIAFSIYAGYIVKLLWAKSMFFLTMLLHDTLTVIFTLHFHASAAQELH